MRWLNSNKQCVYLFTCSHIKSVCSCLAAAAAGWIFRLEIQVWVELNCWNAQLLAWFFFRQHEKFFSFSSRKIQIFANCVHLPQLLLQDKLGKKERGRILVKKRNVCCSLAWNWLKLTDNLRPERHAAQLKVCVLLVESVRYACSMQAKRREASLLVTDTHTRWNSSLGKRFLFAKQTLKAAAACNFSLARAIWIIISATNSK